MKIFRLMIFYLELFSRLSTVLLTNLRKLNTNDDISILFLLISGLFGLQRKETQLIL